MKTLVALVFAFAAALPCTGQVVELVKDINSYHDNTYVTTAHQGSVPVTFGVINGKLLFTADDSVHGREFWTSDGTAAGTQMLKDIDPLVKSPRETYMNVYIKLNDSIFLFSAFDNVNGWELWRTNATTAGTYMIKDVNPGAASSYPIQAEKIGDKVIFFCDDGMHGMEPWITDGTASGTTLLKDISPGPGGCARLDTNLNGIGYSIIDWTLGAFAYQNKVFFTVVDNVYHASFWVSDGTSTGTTMLVNNLNAQINHDVHGIGSNCYFFSFDTLQGSQLWMSDGTIAGTMKLTNVTHANPKYISIQENTIVYNNRIFFDMDDVTHGDELWVSNGTTGGTMMVKDMNVGTQDAMPQDMTIVKGKLYFSANDGTKDILAVTDGTTTGTATVAQFNGSISFLTSIYDYLIIAEKESNTARVWRLDTCAAAPVLIKSLPADGFSYAVIGKKQNRVYMYFESSYNSCVYVTDGTAAGTVPCSFPGVTIYYPFFYDYFNTFPTFEYNNAFYYTAEYTDATGYELYRIRDTTSVMSVTPCNTFTAVRPTVMPEFQIYPNPTHDRIYWKGAEVVDMIRITNPAGQMVLQSAVGTSHSIDVNALSAGVYFVQMCFHSGQTGMVRFVKE